MAASASISKMSIQHEALLDIYVTNPFLTLSELSKMTGYTVPWLSVIVNSDVFQVKLRKIRGEVEEDIQTDLVARLKATAAAGLDKTYELIEKSSDLEIVGKTTTDILQALGYGPKGTVTNFNVTQTKNIQQNTTLVGNVPAHIYREAQQNFGRSIPHSPDDANSSDSLVAHGDVLLLSNEEDIKTNANEVTKD